jgi:acyl-CoA hydrolase
MLNTRLAQQNYISSNYTHVARDMDRRGVNAVLVMVAERGGRYSLSCNPDLTLDVVASMRKRGGACAVVGMVNRELPFMPGEAEVDADYFDILIDAPQYQHALFGVPNPMIEPADHAIGILAASLVKDGGALQLGIGSLGDAVAHWLRIRHCDTAIYADAACAMGVDRHHELVQHEGGTAPFVQGLFASSEMFSWGLFTLLRAGVIRRHADLARGPLLQAAFFLGPTAFYRALHELPDDERALLRMASVLRINDLYGEEQLLRRRLRHARFINVCMKATLSGAIVSDGFEDGRVVSGVGGQYNFVAMAHELEQARSILLLRATYDNGRHVEPNIVFNYGHATIPRHLRDIVVTEYGVADLRGRTDAEVAAALIEIADSRFQEKLAEQAKRAGKLPDDWTLPISARDNTPASLRSRLRSLAARGALPRFPLGTDFDDVEQRLIPALRWLKAAGATRTGRLRLIAAWATARENPEHAAALERMGLSRPRNIGERVLRRLMRAALEHTNNRAGGLE